MPTDKNQGVTPENIAPEIPQDVKTAHDAVMGYTRSGLWVRVGKIVIAASLAVIILFYLISRIFTSGDSPVIAPTDPNQVVNGVDGTNGVDGKDGKDGEDGADGQDGADGAKGDKGDRGPQGPQGPQGPAGTGGDGSISPNDKSNFVISLEDMTKGIAISESRDLWGNTTPYLHATALKDCWNITYADIPSGVDSEKGGTKNGKNYFAYTFFLKNTSKEGTSPLDYQINLRLKNDRTGAIEAIRFQLYEDGVSTIYGADRTDSPGNKEQFACNAIFTGDVNLLNKVVRNFKAQDIKRYTIVLWYEGNDPECVDNILPASIDMSMSIEVLD